MSGSDQLEYIKDLLKACSVPALSQDIGSVSIQVAHFDEYRKAVEVQLPLLYDLLQQHGEYIFASDEPSATQMHAGVIILLCEITATTAPYRLEHESLQRNANRLLQQRQPICDAVEQRILAHYQEKIHSNCWKRQLGAVHGFLRYLEIRHNYASKEDSCMSRQWLNFCLSVGLTLHECHEIIYKQIGGRIFQLMLTYAHFSDVQNQNIHSVIYEAIFNDIHFMDSVSSVEQTWACLHKCLDFFNDINSFSWCKLDDMMEVLLRNITLAPITAISICQVEFVTKFGAYFAINREEIEAKCAEDLNEPFALSQFHDICVKNTSYTVFRWAKSILNMFIVDAYKLMQGLSISCQFLKNLHKCYMVCITPIGLQIIEPHLLPFYDKFTAVLMEAIVVQKHDPTFVKLVKRVLETFSIQLQHDSHSDVSAKFAKYREAFKKLLEQELFL